MRLLIATILLFLTIAASAQKDSAPQGYFNVTWTRGCDDFTIDIQDPLNRCSTIGCHAKFGDGTERFLNSASDRIHTYQEPGTYNLSILTGIETETFQITVFQDTLPEFVVGNCTGGAISLEVIDTNYDSYFVDWGDGTTSTTTSNASIEHSPGAGSYTVTVTGLHNDAETNCSPASKTVIVNDISAPQMSMLEVLDESSVQLEFTTAQDVFYRLEVAVNGSSTYQQIRSITTETEVTVAGLKPEQNYYCFRLGAYNPCDNQIAADDYSQPLCSSFVELDVQNNVNLVSYTTHATLPSGYRFVIRRTGFSGLETGPNGNPHRDEGLICGNEYCYQLIVQDADRIDRSISLPQCGIAISEDVPSAIADISTIVENGVTLAWLEPADFNAEAYMVYKSTDGYQLLDTITETTFTDPTYVSGSGSCYKVNYSDACGNTSSQSAEVCPLFLTGSLTRENHVSLSWNSYAGYNNSSQEYVVEKYTVGGTLMDSEPVGAVTSYLDESEDLLVQQYVYVVKALSDAIGVDHSVSNQILIIKEPNIFHPTSFTPDQQGPAENELFRVWGRYVSEFEMDIFNRWGELMFSTNDIETGWDGTFKGTPMPDGTYTFVARLTDFAGRQFKRSGSVLLLRKK